MIIIQSGMDSNQSSSTEVTTASRLRIGMGTFIAIEATCNQPQPPLRGIDAAFAAIGRVDVLMHPRRPGSDLAAIHAAKIGTSVRVHAWTWEVLNLAKRLNRGSQGLFDPCLPEAPGRIADLELAAPHCVIAHAPLRIDLGGIAKGFAVDRAILAMRRAGCVAGLVNAGGDLAVFGDRSRNAACTTPAGTNIMVALKNAALATSDAANLTRPTEHRGYYHGVDRFEIKSGRITVGAPTAAIADGLTKCLIADPQASGFLLKTFAAHMIAAEESGCDR